MNFLKRYWWVAAGVAAGYVYYKYKKQGGITILGTSYMAPLDLSK